MIHVVESILSPDDPGSVGPRYQSNIPLGRYGTAEEVANLVMFLSSDLATQHHRRAICGGWRADRHRAARSPATWCAEMLDF